MVALVARHPRVRVDMIMRVTQELKQFHTDERGQMAMTFMLSSLLFFIIFALAIDAGIWYFDHRGAQNQSEAAALAAARALPASTTTAATSLANQWLGFNNASSSDCPSTQVTSEGTLS